MEDLNSIAPTASSRYEMRSISVTRDRKLHPPDPKECEIVADPGRTAGGGEPRDAGFQGTRRKFGELSTEGDPNVRQLEPDPRLAEMLGGAPRRGVNPRDGSPSLP
jgi:hypothetical protein